MFGPALSQLIGAATLLSGSDRLPPGALTSGLSATFAVGTAVLAWPGLPVWAAFVVVSGLGVGASLGGAVRNGLLTEIVTADGYRLGRSVLNMSVGAMQIGGVAGGGGRGGAPAAPGTLPARGPPSPRRAGGLVARRDPAASPRRPAP